MIHFENDYNRTAIPEVIDALAGLGDSSYSGYGDDEICAEAASRIQEHLNNDNSKIWFLPGATQTNFIVVASALQTIQSVICADTGHINVHEAVSIENTGHKIEPIPSPDGKINGEQIKKAAAHYYDSGEPEYYNEPKMVYISYPTELGTLYSKAELEAIREACDEYDMYLFVDGARMGYGLTAPGNDLTLEDFARLTDAFFIGGTKCGAMFGEAVVISHPALKRKFKTFMKQNGAVLAKGWTLGVQFNELFKDDRYFTANKKANNYAVRLKEAFLSKGIREFVPSPTNQLFVVITPQQRAILETKYIFMEQEVLEDGNIVVRFCTSWATDEDELNQFIEDINRLP